MILKLIKYGLVGFLGFIIDFGITYTLKEKCRWNKFLANAMGFCLSVFVCFFMNKIWTFQDTDPRVVRQLLLFLSVSLIGLTLNTLILFFFNEKKKYNFYFSKIVAILVVFLWNFSINMLITFR